ncbi:EAL domain-containing protein, partial [Bacillus thuringiensis]
LNMKVIAEGVETKEQLTVLQRNACYFIQGYYYSKPLNKDEFINFLNRKV